jgi:hypothetical protein
LNVTALTIVVGTLIPLLTGLVAKEKNGTVRAVADGLLSAVAGAITLAITEGGSVSLASWVLGIAATWGASILAYNGFWGPTGFLDRAVEWVAAKLAKVGIHLPQSEIVSVEAAIKALFGDAVQFLSAEELKHHLHPTPTPAPVTSVTNVVNCCGAGQACSSATCTGTPPSTEKDDVPPLQGPGHNFTAEGCA